MRNTVKSIRKKILYLTTLPTWKWPINHLNESQTMTNLTHMKDKLQMRLTHIWHVHKTWTSWVDQAATANSLLLGHISPTAASFMNTICWILHEQQQLNEHYFHYKHYLLEPSWTTTAWGTLFPSWTSFAVAFMNSNSWMNALSFMNIICSSLHEWKQLEAHYFFDKLYLL